MFHITGCIIQVAAKKAKMEADPNKKDLEQAEAVDEGELDEDDDDDQEDEDNETKEREAREARKRHLAEETNEQLEIDKAALIEAAKKRPTVKVAARRSTLKPPNCNRKQNQQNQLNLQQSAT